MTNLIPLWVVIPTSFRHDYLQGIFGASGVSMDKTILVRTAPGEPIAGAINLYDLDGINIHRWWNLGIDYARKNGAKYVAILNDDTVLQVGDLQKLLNLMIFEETTLALPVAKGNAGWGHCWILDLSHGVFPDERFHWWCGDHDLEIRALRKNGVSYLPLPILNKHANELTVESTQLQELAKRDIKEFRRKYPIKAMVEFYKRVLKKFSLFK